MIKTCFRNNRFSKDLLPLIYLLDLKETKYTMSTVKSFLFVLLAIISIFNYVYTLNNHSLRKYKGEDFPKKYLVSEKITPKMADLKNYTITLSRAMGWFMLKPNNTNVNVAVGLHFMKATLKRVIQDYGRILQKNSFKDIFDTIKELIKNAKFLLSHYIWKNTQYYWNDLEFRVSRIFTDDALVVQNIKQFNRDKLQKWLRSSIKLHDHIREMDNLTFPKEDYADVVEYREKYHIHLPYSDVCISRVMLNPEPTNVTEIRPCRYDPFCIHNIYRAPSIAYSLSHRFINNLLYNIRRCYLRSEEEDLEHMEMLCAFMYREAVYLARRGFFARDLFMEHVALCGLLGYQEFHRRHWFNKVASWQNNQGCIIENPNFELHRVAAVSKHYSPSSKQYKMVMEARRRKSKLGCHDHPMALLLVVMAHGIRYTLHLMKNLL